MKATYITLSSLVLAMILVILTTAQSSSSKEVQDDRGNVFIAKATKRGHIPFTKIWLRRDLELFKKISPSKQLKLLSYTLKGLDLDEDLLPPSISTDGVKLEINWARNGDKLSHHISYPTRGFP